MNEQMKPIETIRKPLKLVPSVTDEGEDSPAKTERTIEVRETAPIEEGVVRKLVTSKKKVETGDDRSPRKTERGLVTEAETEPSEPREGVRKRVVPKV